MNVLKAVEVIEIEWFDWVVDSFVIARLFVGSLDEYVGSQAEFVGFVV